MATFYSLMHGAAEEVDAGRLDPAQAAGMLTATILAALADQTDRPQPSEPTSAP